MRLVHIDDGCVLVITAKDGTRWAAYGNTPAAALVRLGDLLANADSSIDWQRVRDRTFIGGPS